MQLEVRDDESGGMRYELDVGSGLDFGRREIDASLISRPSRNSKSFPFKYTLWAPKNS